MGSRRPSPAQAALGISEGLTGKLAYVVLCNGWAPAHKGAAIGIVFTGFAVAGMLWVPLAAAITEMHGWRAALAVLAAVQWAVSLPIACLGFREPELRQPPTAKTAGSDAGARAADDAVGARRLPWWARERGVWHIAIFSFSTM